MVKLVSVTWIIAMSLLVFAPPLEARPGGGSGGMGGQGKMMGGGKKPEGGQGENVPRQEYEARGLFETRLRAVFPVGVSCPEVASPFGSQTRYDGSWRSNNHHGYHNGMDISLEPGTPLLAIADGEVVHGGEGGMLVGNFIWIRYAPAETGFSAYAFVRYQHLNQPPSLSAGDKVKVGQTVAFSGATGTYGGHFGDYGYPHLHMNILISATPDFELTGAMLKVSGRKYLDPLGLYVRQQGSSLDNFVLRDLSENQKAVSIPVQTQGGARIPPSASAVWPVACSTMPGSG